MEDYKARFKDAEWFNFSDPIIVGGAGGTGSNFCYAAGSAGYNIYVYDYDTYDKTNIAGQFVKPSQIGKPKVEALIDNIYEFRKEYITGINEKYTEDSMISPIMVSAFDNMEARHVMFKKWSEQENPGLFIDMRMDAENFQIYNVSSKFIKLFKEKHLPNEADVPEPRCTLKQTTHVGMVCAGLAFSFLTNYITNQREGINLRRIPFKFELNIPAFHGRKIS